MKRKLLCIILAAAIVLGVVVAVRSCVTRIEPDLTLSYIGESYFDSEKFYAEASLLEDKIEDVNGDGNKKVELAVIAFMSALTASQEQNNLTKLTMSMGSGQSRVYLMDEAYCMRYADSEFLADLSEYADGAASVLQNSEGKIYGISVAGNPLLAQIGLADTEGVYIALRAVTELDGVNFKNIDDIDKQARVLLRYIINNNNNIENTENGV